MVRDLDIEDVRAGLAAGTMLIVDVRETHEFEDAAIPGSISHPLSSFDPTALPTGEGRRIVFSCAAGIRSRVAIGLCQQAGLDLREHYLGGLSEWARAGEALVHA